MLKLSGIEKKYGNRTVLQIPSLSIDNKIYWIKGENGTGKTTLLKMIAGIIPFTGSISLDGIDLKKETVAYKKNISWAEAEPQYPPYMRGTELITLYSNVYQCDFDQQEILELLNMKAWVNDRINTYSSGMQKKLSLALALLPRTPVVLLDEPFITLDEQAVSNLATYMSTALATEQRTLLISSHQPLQECGVAFNKTIITQDTTVKEV